MVFSSVQVITIDTVDYIQYYSEAMPSAGRSALLRTRSESIEMSTKYFAQQIRAYARYIFTTHTRCALT